MKKILLLISALIGLLILSLAIIPLFLEDTVRTRLQEELDRQLSEEHSFDEKSIDLSFFRDFPFINIKAKDLWISGKGRGVTDTLFSCEEIEISLNQFSGKIRTIRLRSPVIIAEKLDSIQNNWDVLKASDVDVQSQDNSSSEVETQERKEIPKIVVEDGKFYFSDPIKGVEGRFSGVSLDLVQLSFLEDGLGAEYYLSGEVQDSRLKKGNTTVLDHHKLGAEFHFRISENKAGILISYIQINDLELGLTGEVDLKSGTGNIGLQENDRSIEKLISAIPGVDMEAVRKNPLEGTFGLNASIRIEDGNAKLQKASLGLENGRFTLPRIRDEISGLAANIKLTNDSIPILVIDLFKAELGGRPIALEGRVIGAASPFAKGSVKAELKLEEFQELYPIENTELKGLLMADLEIEGVFSKESFPNIQGDISIQEGFLHPPDLQKPMEDLELKASFQSKGGSLDNSSGSIQNLSFRIGEDEMKIAGEIADMTHLEHDLRISGRLDLENFSKLLPEEHWEVSGFLFADLHSQGVIKGLQDQRKIRLEGSVELENIEYQRKDRGQVILIHQLEMALMGESFRLKDLMGKVGHSDFKIKGTGYNYSDFLLNQGELNLNLTLEAKRVKLDEAKGMRGKDQGKGPVGMGNDETKKPAFGSINLSTVFQVKDFENEGIKLQDLSGKLQAGPENFNLTNVHFQGFGGSSSLDFSSKKVGQGIEKFSFQLNSRNLDIHRTYISLQTISRLAPAAEKMEGQANIQMDLKGYRNAGGTPIDSMITGTLGVGIKNAAIQNFDLIKNMMSTVKVPGLSNWVKKEYRLSDFQTKGEMIAGRFCFDPFKVVLNDHPFEFFGSYGLDGTLDYLVATEFKPENLGTIANIALTTILGGSYDPEQLLEIDFQIKGSRKNPNVRLLSLNPKGSPGHYSDPMEEEKKKADQRRVSEKIRQEAYMERFEENLFQGKGKR